MQKLNHHNIYGYGSSAYNSNYIGEKALDGNKYTKWNTSYWYGPPHSLVMDLGDIYSSGIEIGAVGILHAGWCEYDKYPTLPGIFQTH